MKVRENTSMFKINAPKDLWGHYHLWLEGVSGDGKQKPQSTTVM